MSNFHENYQRKVFIQAESEKKFGLILALIVGAVGLSKFPSRSWMLGVSGFLIILSFFYPKGLTLFKKGWLFLGEFLQKIFGVIFLLLLFFGVFTPIGLVMRFIFKKEILRLKKSETSVSYWQETKQFQINFKEQF